MYGLVNRAVEELITTRFGLDAWERVKARAGIDVDLFLSDESYPDATTYQLIGAACEELQLDAQAVLVEFGKHWVLHTAVESYGEMLKMGGRTLPEFLRNLPNFHARVVLIYPDLKPPRFSCTHVTAESMTLHYHSDRPGLTAFVEGVLLGLSELYETPIEIVLGPNRGTGHDHDEFQLRWQAAQAA